MESATINSPGRSFRKNVLTHSIMSIFAKPEVSTSSKSAPEPNHRSDSSNGAEVKHLEKTYDEKTTSLQTTYTPKDGEVEQFGKIHPFAGGIDGGVNYQTMTWWQCGMVMIAETISLGILSLPRTLADLGLIPGLILLIALGLLATYTGYVISQFKLRYPYIHSMADAGEVLFGKIGREVIGAAQLLFIVFIMASHLITFSIMMNAITSHARCTVIFMTIGLIISLLFTLPRTLRNLSWYSIASFVSIIGAVFVTMVGVSIDKPGHVLENGHFIQKIDLWPPAQTTFTIAFLAVCNMVFAYSGHVAFFSFISELRNPKDFPKSLALLQGSDISMYIIVAVVIYYYSGANVASPALDSASPLLRKVAYGIAIPTIVIAGVVNGHVAVKYLYVRMLRNSEDDVIHQKTPKAYGIWAAICTVLWVVGWLLAELVPNFQNILGLSGALFASWFTFGLSGMMWLYMNLMMQGKGLRMRLVWRVAGENWKRWGLLALNFFNILMGLIICVVGLYATGMSIARGSKELSQKPFSCADNSGAEGPH